MNKTQAIQHLGLEPHMEGAYFKRIYEAGQWFDLAGQQRRIMTSIYYMLTDDSPIGQLHKNQADIVHYFIAGSALQYTILHPHGLLEEVVLGNDIEQGQQIHLIVKGGCWKATKLCNGEYGLITEAVTPGFEYSDMELASHTTMSSSFPEFYPVLKPYIATN